MTNENLIAVLKTAQKEIVTPQMYTMLEDSITTLRKENADTKSGNFGLTRRMERCEYWFYQCAGFQQTILLDLHTIKNKSRKCWFMTSTDKVAFLEH